MSTSANIAQEPEPREPRLTQGRAIALLVLLKVLLLATLVAGLPIRVTLILVVVLFATTLVAERLLEPLVSRRARSGR